MCTRRSLFNVSSKLLNNIKNRHYSILQKERQFQEIRIPMPWGHIAGKWWDPSNKRPILALHGWQDNCGSFDRLIPLLPDEIGVLAIDLPGHGLSSRLPPGMYYHNMNYPILIKQIAHYFQWPKISLMGHSLGAISCYTYTMIFPESVDFLLCFDGLKPVKMRNNGPRMAIGLKEHIKYDKLARSAEEPPAYTLEEMKEMLCKSNNKSVSRECVDHIIGRNIAPSKKFPGKLYFTRDPRIKARLILNWDPQELLEGAKRVTCPIYVMKSSQSAFRDENFFEVLEIVRKNSKDCLYEEIEGTHHVHLNNPEKLIPSIEKFITKHNIEDRSSGGIRNDIISTNCT